MSDIDWARLAAAAQEPPRARDLGVPFDGTPGPLNAITDVAGVTVTDVYVPDESACDQDGCPVVVMLHGGDGDPVSPSHRSRTFGTFLVVVGALGMFNEPYTPDLPGIDEFAGTMSGGERQMVSVGRALMTSPSRSVGSGMPTTPASSRWRRDWYSVFRWPR